MSRLNRLDLNLLCKADEVVNCFHVGTQPKIFFPLLFVKQTKYELIMQTTLNISSAALCFDNFSFFNYR